MTPEEEKEVIKRAQNGDEDAWENLFQEYNDKLYRTVFYQVNNEDLANVIVEETWLKCVQKINQFKGKSRLLTWLTTIAYNIIKKESYKQKPISLDIPIRQKDGTETVRDYPSDLLEPVEMIIKREEKQKLEESILDLSPTYTEVIALYRNGLLVKEIAEILEITENNVKQRHTRAIKILKSTLNVKELELPPLEYNIEKEDMNYDE